ncbi:MAG TPA: hypothetical protein VGQ81_08850 [Acidobacteriota bacterium]|nr:hypothetical protein [Acidobacteriota bacterium]
MRIICSQSTVCANWKCKFGRLPLVIRQLSGVSNHSSFALRHSTFRLLPILIVVALSLTTAAAGTHVLIVAGLGGDPTYDKLFSEWVEQLNARLKTSAASITTLAPGKEPAPRRENILAALKKYQTLRHDDLFILFLIGHGSFDQKQYRFNIPGPDITAEELAGAIARISAQAAVINATAASGASLPILSSKNRVVITATRSGAETNPPRFIQFLIEGLDGRADADKNGSISILELFQYARKKTAEWYQSQNRLASEHALLDDSGDGKGTADPVPGSPDGALAASLRITSGSDTQQEKGNSATQALIRRKRELEAAIEKLRFRKSEMSDEAYQQELEKLALELARVNKQIAEGHE